MAATARATIEDLYHVKGKAEIVDGEIVLMSPTGGLPGIAGGIIYASLLAHQRRAGGGYALPDNVGFVVELPRRRSFSPDAAFHRGPKPTMKFIQGAPALAVEVRSEDDYGPAAEKAMAAKRADYFAAGTEVVWDVDLQGQETIRAYRALEPGSRVFRRGDVADAEPAVPGWRFPVDELFEQARSRPDQLLASLSLDLGPLPKADDEAFGRVVDAFVRHRRLLVRYRSNDGGHTRDRVIDPYRVFNLAGVWYVAAFDDRRRTVRNFALHRIRGATVTEEAFTPDPSFDFAAYREGTFGIERGTVPLNVAIRFGSYQARWIRERAWLSPVATPGHH